MDKLLLHLPDLLDIDLTEIRESVWLTTFLIYILMSIDEVPVEMGHRAGLLLHRVATSLTVVTHLLDIVPSGDIRLRRETTSVTILTHTHDIRYDDPLERVSIHLIEPPGDFERVISA